MRRLETLCLFVTRETVYRLTGSSATVTCAESGTNCPAYWPRCSPPTTPSHATTPIPLDPSVLKSTAGCFLFSHLWGFTKSSFHSDSAIELQQQELVVNFKLFHEFHDLRSNGSNLNNRNGYRVSIMYFSSCVQFSSLDQVEISPQRMCLSICLILSGVKLTNWDHPYFHLKLTSGR